MPCSTPLSSMNSNAVSKPARWEYLIPALTIASFIVASFKAATKRYFWIDELQTFYLASDHSLRHMLSALADRFTSAPPLFFSTAWAWAHLFGATETSLRVLSSLGICLALAAVWLTLRRNYPFWPTTIATLICFTCSQNILYHNSEARPYGWFLGFCAVAVLLFDSANRKTNLSWGFLAATALAHVLLIQNHLFGVFYSGAILAAFLARDVVFKVFRPKLYLAVVAAWLSLLPVIPALITQADAGKPRSCYYPPVTSDLIEALIIRSEFFVFALLVVVLIAAAQTVLAAWNRETVPAEGTDRSQAEASLLILALAFVGLAVAIWVGSKVIYPIFLSRYVIPSSGLVWPILLGAVFWRIFLNPQRLNRFTALASNLLFIGLTAMLVLHPINAAKGMKPEELPGAQDKKFGYSELPLVVAFSHDFITRFHYSPDAKRYYFLLDWDAALDRRSGSFGPMEYKSMEALTRHYRDSLGNNVVQANDFLKSNPRFLFLERTTPDTDFQYPYWFDQKVRNNPDYKVTPLGELPQKRLLLVEKTTGTDS